MIAEKVYIIGTGMLAINCAKYAKEQGLPVMLFDMGKRISASVMLEKQARMKEVPYFHKRPGEVFTLLCEEQKNILLVSAINEVIVPGKVLEKKSITAINLHQALLPAHPGRNAEVWTIFEQDDVSGITWHIMEPKVDKGEILVQKEIPLDHTTTSFSLFHQQISCAFDAFKEIFESLIKGTYKSIPQKPGPYAVYHFNKDIPNEGWLTLEWSAAKISAFLRSMDHGVLKILKPPRIYLNGQVFEWKKYEIYPSVTRRAQEVTVEENGKIDIIIRKENTEIILKKCIHKEEK